MTKLTKVLRNALYGTAAAAVLSLALFAASGTDAVARPGFTTSPYATPPQQEMSEVTLAATEPSCSQEKH